MKRRNPKNEEEPRKKEEIWKKGTQKRSRNLEEEKEP